MVPVTGSIPVTHDAGSSPVRDGFYVSVGSPIAARRGKKEAL
jgi:hypothetical protein